MSQPKLDSTLVMAASTRQEIPNLLPAALQVGPSAACAPAQGFVALRPELMLLGLPELALSSGSACAAGAVASRASAAIRAACGFALRLTH